MVKTPKKTPPKKMTTMELLNAKGKKPERIDLLNGEWEKIDELRLLYPMICENKRQFVHQVMRGLLSLSDPTVVLDVIFQAKAMIKA